MAFNSFRLERDVGESQTESTERESTEKDKKKLNE